MEKVFLVEARPGDPDLLTVKALRILERAEAVVYDRLARADVLSLVARAVLIDGGEQDRIHDEIIQIENETTTQERVVEAALSAVAAEQVEVYPPAIFETGDVATIAPPLSHEGTDWQLDYRFSRNYGGRAFADRLAVRPYGSAPCVRLLALGSLPVIGVGFSHDYTSFLLFRLAIGVIGASFVITQFHTPLMFAPNVMGTGNGTAAGWGNLGGSVTQIVMPLLFAAFLSLGMSAWWSWRLW